MDPKIDKQTRTRLTSGDVDGRSLKPESQHSEGVVVTRPDGQKVFLTQETIDIAKYRNRGRD